MLVYILLFVGQFMNVFLLGMNSQVVRDRKVALSFIISWGISASQFVYIYIIANADNVALSFFVSGFGGAFGICFSIYFYTWFKTTKLGKRIWSQ